jgi:hypothetical protein
VYTPATHPDSTLNSDRQLLVKPDLDSGALLQELEDEIDGWEQDFAPAASSTSIHFAG